MNDDSRGLESPDRPHASTPNDRVACDGGTTDESVRERLETITELTNSILEEVRNPDTASDLEDISDETRRGATRRLREIDAEARRVGLELFGPGMLIPRRSAEKVDDDRQTDDLPTVVGCDSLTTTFRGPIPGALEHATGDRKPASIDELLDGEIGTADDSNHADTTNHDDTTNRTPNEDNGDRDGE
ncbi:hypothetical protein [Natrinema sp. CBA1119]|uniref:hypothetical protein n=1 Tax=Natrinema sp. CBA1119 TaxID=1608465 RepID=UPI00159BB4E0|nr:hypothetical protein [Natrinema sp. CBA1119]